MSGVWVWSSELDRKPHDCFVASHMDAAHVYFSYTAIFPKLGVPFQQLYPIILGRPYASPY